MLVILYLKAPDGIIKEYIIIIILRDNLHVSTKTLNHSDSFVLKQDNNSENSTKKVKD